MSAIFHFKQFSVCQERAAMKIGTDGVLLGAWVAVDTSMYNILDIGAGTGLLGLMLAQRTEAQNIDAIEIDAAAYEEAVENFEKSKWNDRLFCYHASLQEFVDEIDEKYDLIVANPPYFNPTKTEMDASRSRARHSASLSFDTLLQATSKLLTDNGSCAFIIPFEEEERFVKLGEAVGLFPNRVCRVRGTSKSALKRTLIQLSANRSRLTENELVIENARHDYTEQYTKLVSAFYLKM